MNQFRKTVEGYLNRADELELRQLYKIVTDAAMQNVEPIWNSVRRGKKACWFSCEFLLGRLIYSNLYNLGLLADLAQAFERNGLDLSIFEEIEDAALGNGGLGRLSACYLDSGATVGLPLDGYGIRYKYGLFKQSIHNGFQYTAADNWTRYGDPWSRRHEDEKVLVRFSKQSVWAVPYDMPIIGYGGKTVNNLRLWQSEPVNGFDFHEFNNQSYLEAYAEDNEARSISAILYPNDDGEAGRKLRIKQQYFFSSASLQSILRDYKKNNKGSMSGFSSCFALHINDTHPSIAIPELTRLLVEEHDMSFEEAFPVVVDSFSYTNHTVISEALEKWSVDLFGSVIPEVYPYIIMIQNRLRKELKSKGVRDLSQQPYYIVDNGLIHMARMAIFASHSTNGVSEIHTKILKEEVLPEWHAIYPERFSNKTNGITQRRWLGLCNPELAEWVSTHVGNGWITDLTKLKKLAALADDPKALRQFSDIKRRNKERLADYVFARERGFKLNADAIFDVQVKRLHEYKRQLLNAFSIMDIYFQIKDGKLPGFYPTSFIFGAKAAPGYRRANGIIKYISEIARLINKDPDMNGKMQVLFVQDYNVSYAEKIIPAAEVSEQISTAGTEGSGTSNMKMMLNGAVILGTRDGANIEIVEQAGLENNYIFGAQVDEIRQISDTYNPQKLYMENSRIRRVLDTLISGIFSDDGCGVFEELYNSILKGASWHKPDHYYLLLDLIPYIEAKLRINGAYRDKMKFTRQCLLNTANSGVFSSDNSIRQYAEGIWRL